LRDRFWAEAKLLGRSAITALDTATFQRTPEYSPSYHSGRLAAVVETLLVSSLFALFLLARGGSSDGKGLCNNIPFVRRALACR
jgi:hypothetical protein